MAAYSPAPKVLLESALEQLTLGLLVYMYRCIGVYVYIYVCMYIWSSIPTDFTQLSILCNCI